MSTSSVQWLVARCWWWTGLCTVLARSDRSFWHCRSWSADVSTWASVWAAWTSPIVVSIISEWQNDYSFVWWYHVIHGVHCVLGPQGSVLGPRLFILYTTDLPNITEKHGVTLTRVCWRHTAVSALSSWRYGVYCCTTWALPHGSRPLDVFQSAQVEPQQNWAALGWI